MRKRKRSNNNFKKSIIYFGLITATIIITVGMFLTNREVVVSHVETHGPRVAATYNSKPVVAIPKVKTPTTKVPNEATYGIAAGGGLIRMSQTDLNSYFGRLKALGVKWVRWDIDWSIVQPANSQNFNWNGVDMVANTAKQYDIKNLAIITYTPAWARSDACKGDNKCAPANPLQYGAFASTVASRYADGRITTFEIWNEPNYANFWLPHPNVNDYGKLLEAAYASIKKANPSATVITGGLASSGDDSGNISPLSFIKSLYDQGYSSDFDAVAIHPYSYPSLPSLNVPWNRWQQIIPIHNLLVAQGNSNKLIWITEYGAPTGGSGVPHTSSELDNFTYRSDYMHESTQVALMADALSLYQQYATWTGPFFWYSLKDDSANRSSTESYYGLIRADGTEKPAYTTFRNIILSSRVSP